MFEQLESLLKMAAQSRTLYISHQVFTIKYLFNLTFKVKTRIINQISSLSFHN